MCALSFASSREIYCSCFLELNTYPIKKNVCDYISVVGHLNEKFLLNWNHQENVSAQSLIRMLDPKALVIYRGRHKVSFQKFHKKQKHSRQNQKLAFRWYLNWNGNLSSKFITETHEEKMIAELKTTYLVEYVAEAFRHEADIRCFTPYEKIKANVHKAQLLFIATWRKPANRKTIHQ